jgi:outer membrane lipoprotein
MPISRPVVRLLAAALLAAELAPMGCATTGEHCRRPIGDRSLTPAVAAAGDGQVGASITWGGTLVSSKNLADATDLEVLAYPLDDCGRPLLGEPAQGRFIIRRPGYLETADLAPGRRVTASGRIIASAEGHIGEADYRFPVLEDAAPTIWPERNGGYGGSVRPWISIGVGGGSGWSGGGVGIWF